MSGAKLSFPMFAAFGSCVLEQGDPDTARPRHQGRPDPESERWEKGEGNPNPKPGIVLPKAPT